MELLDGKISAIEEKLGESHDVTVKKLDVLKDRVISSLTCADCKDTTEL